LPAFGLLRKAKTMQEINRTANPFPGLRPFESAETHLFFGRDGQSEELLRRLKRTRFLAVVGTSGSGKSSLVRAGLLPALQGGLMAGAGSDWRIAIMRPGSDPVGNLARALASPMVLGSVDGDQSADMQAILAETTLRRSSLGLVELVSRARTKVDEGGQPLFHDYENLLVVVDQFEELFRFKQLIEEENSQEDAAAFVKLLLEAVRQPEGKIYVVLTMRSDFLGDCSQFWDLPEAINSGQYLIPRMTRDERREAITGPVAVGQGAISEPLVNQLLNDVGDNPDQLPILQHALMRTWAYWRGHPRNGAPMDIPDYKDTGGMAKALSRHADEAYDELSAEQKLIAEKMFKGLTEKGADNREIRRPMEAQEICELTGADQAEVIRVVEAFRREGRSFLMPPPTDALTGAPIPLTGESLIDISHESLIRNWERLKTWVDNEAKSARIYKRLAETAVLYSEGRAGLWRGPDLQIALKWREEDKPNQVWARRYHPEFKNAMAFLDKSRLRRRLMLVFYCVLLVAGVAMLSGMAWYRQQVLIAERKTAREEEQRAKEKASNAEQQNKAVGNKLQSSILEGLKPEAAALALKLISAATAKGIEVRLISGYRSTEDQRALYEQGRTRPGMIVTKTRFSTHNTGLAFDVAVVKDGKILFDGPEFDILGSLGEQLGLVWGGRQTHFADRPHFETRDALEALKKLRQS
jgi:energy-coupling factor transporter ATP-binding protein EcfA2